MAYIPYDKNAIIVDVGCRSGQTIQTLIRFGYRNAYGLDLGDTTWSGLSADVKNNFIKCKLPTRVIKIIHQHIAQCGSLFKYTIGDKVLLIFGNNYTSTNFII